MTDNQGQATEELGARIRRLRQEKGLSQDRLALRSHLDQSGLSKYERGKDRGISEAALRRVAAVLETTFEELVEGTDY